MNKIIGILKKWKNPIKLVLFMSIGSLVIIEIIRMFRSISIDEVTSTIGTIAPEKVLFLFVLGFAAVSPMILYKAKSKAFISHRDKLDNQHTE